MTCLTTNNAYIATECGTPSISNCSSSMKDQQPRPPTRRGSMENYVHKGEIVHATRSSLDRQNDIQVFMNTLQSCHSSMPDMRNQTALLKRTKTAVAYNDSSSKEGEHSSGGSDASNHKKIQRTTSAPEFKLSHRHSVSSKRSQRRSTKKSNMKWSNSLETIDEFQRNCFANSGSGNVQQQQRVQSSLRRNTHSQPMVGLKNYSSRDTLLDSSSSSSSFGRTIGSSGKTKLSSQLLLDLSKDLQRSKKEKSGSKTTTATKVSSDKIRDDMRKDLLGISSNEQKACCSTNDIPSTKISLLLRGDLMHDLHLPSKMKKDDYYSKRSSSISTSKISSMLRNELKKDLQHLSTTKATCSSNRSRKDFVQRSLNAAVYVDAAVDEPSNSATGMLSSSISSPCCLHSSSIKA